MLIDKIVSGPVVTNSGTVGTTSTIVIAVQTGRQFLQISNPSASALLAFSFDGTPAVINGAGCVTLNPGGSASYTPDGFVPTNSVNLISSISSCPYTIFTF